MCYRKENLEFREQRGNGRRKQILKEREKFKVDSCGQQISINSLCIILMYLII